MLIDNANDAHQRYSGMYGFYKDKYILVRECVAGPSGEVLVIFNTIKGKKKELEPLSELFNMTDFKFGYLYDPSINVGSYLTRSPRRETRQGIHPNGIRFDKYINRAPVSPHFDHDSFTKSDLFANMLRGKLVYSIDEAFQRVYNYDLPSTSFPLSNQFALRRSDEYEELVFLIFKGEDVVGTLDGYDIKLSKRYTYLRESLHRDGIKVT